LAALEDDLNTPMALSHLHEAAHALNKATRPADKARLKGDLLAAGSLLGLLEQDPEEWLKGRIVSAVAIAVGTSSARAVGEAIRGEDWINQQIAARAAARKARDFAEADRIRDELAKAGIILEDGPVGTTWRRGG
ncbi:MAG: DALR domain-containing protein, partial [Dongiaceae bacterium]